MLELAIENAKQRHTENITETGEAILVQILLRMVKGDNYYKVKNIKERMLGEFDDEQKWLTSRWVGSALRRLGFKEKRRVGTGYEYLLHVDDVKDLADRMQITLPLAEEPKGSLIDQAWSKPSLAKLEQQLSTSWSKGTIDNFTKLAQHKGELSKAEAERFVEDLFDKGRVMYDPEGWLVWV